MNSPVAASLRHLKLRYLAVAGIVGGALVLTGCAGGTGSPSALKASNTGQTGNSGSAQSTSTTAPTAELAQEYSTAAYDLNTAGSAAAAVTAPVGESPAEMSDLLSPFDSSLNAFEEALTSIPWPSSMTSDAHALETQVSAFMGVIQSVGDQNAMSAAAFGAQMQSEGDSMSTAANILRQDLGLPSSNGGV